MVYFASTTLNKKVKEGLLNNTYTKDEARAIYKEYLKLKKDRMTGFKRAGIVIISVLVLMSVLNLFNKNNPVSDMGMGALFFSSLLMPLSFLLIFFLVYYMMFGRFSMQIHSAMKIHYSDILMEMKGK